MKIGNFIDAVWELGNCIDGYNAYISAMSHNNHFSVALYRGENPMDTFKTYTFKDDETFDSQLEVCKRELNAMVKKAVEEMGK